MIDPRHQLLGSIQRKSLIDDISVPLEQLARALPDNDYAVYFFCKGCGTVLPVLKAAVGQIVGSELPAYDGQYIAVTRCDLCSDSFTGGEFRQIPTRLSGGS